MAVDFALLTNPWTVGWTVGLFTAFLVLLAIFSIGGPCKAKAGEAAHHLVMVAPFAFLALNGCLHWNRECSKVPQTSQDRLFFTFTAADCYSPTMLGLQIFDLTTTALVPSMQRIDAIAHHLVALVLAYQLTAFRFLQYWQPFYFGVLEASSVPLCFVDFFRAFPALAKRFDAVNEVARLLFAGAFLPIRCLYMPYVSVLWWKDFLTLYAAGDERIAEHILLFSCFGAMNIFLCGIQQYWGYKVVKAALKMAQGDKSAREKEY